jgi:hypothetical protein
MTPSKVEPMRFSTKRAAVALDLDVAYVRQLVADGVFTPLRPNGKGPGKRLYLYADEVQLYVDAGRDEVLSYRKTQGRLPDETPAKANPKKGT